jgi:hypothetical protein
VPGIPGGEPLALKHVAEMRSAPSALDLDPFPVGIGKATDRSGDLFIERWPAALGVEFAFRSIQRRPTPLALVGTGSEMSLVLPRERALRPFVDDHAFFGSRKGSKGRGRRVGHNLTNFDRY